MERSAIEHVLDGETIMWEGAQHTLDAMPVAVEGTWLPGCDMVVKVTGQEAPLIIPSGTMVDVLVAGA